MRSSSFARVVRGLVLGGVDQHGTHARGDDQVAVSLGLEDPTGGLSGPHDAVEVDAVVPPPRLVGVIEAGNLRADAGVGDHDVETAVAELLGDALCRAGHLGAVRDVGVECLDAPAGGLGYGRGRLGCDFAGVVGKGNVGAGFGEALHDMWTDAAGAADDQADFAGERELLEDRGGDGRGLSEWHGWNQERSEWARMI